jgi:hypothetical protein
MSERRHVKEVCIIFDSPDGSLDKLKHLVENRKLTKFWQNNSNFRKAVVDESEPEDKFTKFSRILVDDCNID